MHILENQSSDRIASPSNFKYRVALENQVRNAPEQLCINIGWNSAFWLNVHLFGLYDVFNSFFLLSGSVDLNRAACSYPHFKFRSWTHQRFPCKSKCFLHVHWINLAQYNIHGYLSTSFIVEKDFTVSYLRSFSRSDQVNHNNSFHFGDEENGHVCICSCLLICPFSWTHFLSADTESLVPRRLVQGAMLVTWRDK